MRRVFAVALCSVALGAFAQSAEVAHPDAAVERRLKSLGEELRCLVCQNQTIADSSAPLAVDLRSQLRSQIAAGRSDDDIRAYMVQRYGDFVLYRPPLRATTLLLWIGPFALMAVGAAIFFVVVRRRRPAEAGSLSSQRRDELAALLEGSEAQAAPASAATGKGDRTGRGR